VLRLAAFLLVIDALLTGVWLANLLPVLAAYDLLVFALLIARGFTAAALFTGGWLLLGDRPAAAAIARGALLVSAMLLTIEIGFRLAPSNLDPTFRWPLVVLYWLYALAVRWYLGRKFGRT
jgi:hypothetical protein